jgi:hypothetical protein
MANLSNEDYERLLNELEEKHPGIRERARRRMEYASKLEPITVVIQVGSEQPAEDEVLLAQARLDAIITGWGEGKYTSADIDIAQKQMAIAYARRSLAHCREYLESQGVKWEDVPDDDDWSGMPSA